MLLLNSLLFYDLFIRCQRITSFQRNHQQHTQYGLICQVDSRQPAKPGHFCRECLLLGHFMITTLRKAPASTDLKRLTELRLFWHVSYQPKSSLHFSFWDVLEIIDRILRFHVILSLYGSIDCMNPIRKSVNRRMKHADRTAPFLCKKFSQVSCTTFSWIWHVELMVCYSSHHRDIDLFDAGRTGDNFRSLKADFHCARACIS